MRHSDLKLTANVYTDPRLLDVHGALDALPSLPLDAEPAADRERLRATGTDDHHSVAPNADKLGQIGAFPDKGTVASPSSIGSAQPGEIRWFSGDFSSFSMAAVGNIPERAHSSGG
jgi:hypothetical protein